MKLDRLTFYIKAAELTQRAVTTDLLGSRGMSFGQLAMMITIVHAPGQSNAALARMHGITAQSAGEIVGSLIKKGWVQRTPDARHAKIFRSYATAKGVDVIEQAEGALTKIDRLLTQGVTPADLETTKRVLRQIVINGGIVIDPILLTALNSEPPQQKGEEDARAR